MLNSVVEISMVYFEYYTIILRGGHFFRGHAVETRISQHCVKLVELWKAGSASDELLCVCCRHLLHRCVQAVTDAGIKLSGVLADSYKQCVHSVNSSSLSAAVTDRLITLGFSLGNHLQLA